jgi:signal transduction histidine kinase
MTLAADLWERTPPENHPKYRDIIKRQTARLGQLVEDILDLSRLEMGKAKGVALEPVDFNLMVEQSVMAHVPRAEYAGLKLTLQLDPDLPQVNGVFNQLSQVVTNLVANAINYTQAGSIAVRTAHNPNTNQVCLEIKDTGFGILAEDIPHLFDRFYRGQKSVEADIPGTGLGLGIAKEIIELHNGTIEVASEVGIGSTFWVHLPVA